MNWGRLVDRSQSQSGKDAFPVFYIEPLADNVTALGLDLASDPTRLDAIDASISKGVVVATAPIRLVQERSQQLGMLLIQYVSGGPNGSGLVLIVLRMATFAKTLVRAAEPILDLRFADAEANVPFFNQIAEFWFADVRNAVRIWRSPLRRTDGSNCSIHIVAPRMGKLGRIGGWSPGNGVARCTFDAGNGAHLSCAEPGRKTAQ